MKRPAYKIGELRGAPRTYRCHVAILKEEEGGFSAIVLNLPGAGSSGPSEEIVVERVREAVVGLIESYLENGEEIPWESPGEYEIPEGAEQKWVLVDAW